MRGTCITVTIYFFIAIEDYANNSNDDDNNDTAVRFTHNYPRMLCQLTFSNDESAWGWKMLSDFMVHQEIEPGSLD